MKVVIETFITIFFITLTVFVATQVIASGLQINNAKEFHMNATRAIEDSGLSNTVVDMYKEKAEEKGYRLTMDYSGENVLRCANCNSAFSVELDISKCVNCDGVNLYIDSASRRGLVCLEYGVQIPLLGISKEGWLETYVR